MKTLTDLAQDVGATIEDEYGYEHEAVGIASITFTPRQLQEFAEILVIEWANQVSNQI